MLDSEKRSKIVCFKVTDKEREAVKKRAKKAGFNGVSDYCRTVIINPEQLKKKAFIKKYGHLGIFEVKE